VETVWQAVSVQGKRLKPLVFGFDLPGRMAKRPVVGASGGLAFVVSAMHKFTGCDFGPVAATGILQSTDLDAPLLAVSAITEKLEAALELVPSGGLVLYPEKNHHEISSQLTARYKDKKIRLRSVRDVNQALEILMDALPPEKHRIPALPRWLLAAACGIVLALLATAGVYLHLDRTQGESLPVVTAPEQAEPAGSPQDAAADTLEPAVLSHAKIQEALHSAAEGERPTAAGDGNSHGAATDRPVRVQEERNSEKTISSPEPEQPVTRSDQPPSPPQPSKGFD
jgi:hypothetical protein